MKCSTLLQGNDADSSEASIECTSLTTADISLSQHWHPLEVCILFFSLILIRIYELPTLKYEWQSSSDIWKIGFQWKLSRFVYISWHVERKFASRVVLFNNEGVLRYVFPQKNENENCEYSRNIISHLSGFQIFHSHFFPHYRGENIWTITLTELVPISTCVWYFNLSCSFDGSRKKELRAFETLHMMFILTFLMRICLTSPTFLLKYISTKSQLTKKIYGNFRIVDIFFSPIC